MISRESTTINVLTQNLLLDKTRTNKGLILPQDDRIDAIADTLKQFAGSLDVVGVQEAYRSKDRHNGMALARECGSESGFWVEHNEKPYEGSPTGRAGEHVGLFGEMVDNARAIELGDRRRALIAMIAGVAFVTLHLRAGESARRLRLEQSQKTVEALEPYDDAVILGDLNEPLIKRFSVARQNFNQHGFTSVFDLTDQPHPRTYPTDPYKKVLAGGHGWRDAFVRRGFSLDDIIVRGPRVRALAAGVLARCSVDESTGKKMPQAPRAGSDHEGLWAKLEID